MITRKALFDQVRELCKAGWWDLQEAGSGAPGRLLESILGLTTSNVDIPDAGTFELKFSRGTSLLTLFHKTPRPRGCMRYLINKHGWIGRNGRPSFRHTIAGESDRGFKIAYDSGSIWVRHDDWLHVVPHWTEDDLLNAAGRKLSRLILVKGQVTKKPRQVKFEHATAYEQIKLSGLMKAIESGLIRVDFDAYLRESGAPRDHGPKFRIHPDEIGRLYEKKTKII